MMKKMLIPILLAGLWSHQVSASCSTGNGDCSIYKGMVQSGQKIQDGVWNKSTEKESDSMIEGLDSLFLSAKKTGEMALSSSMSATIDKGNIDGIFEKWCLNKDMTLSDNMKAWVKRANWNLHWNTVYDYPIDAGFCVSGSFQQAINIVASGYMTAQRVLRLDVYPNQSIIVFSTK